jgi:hypothetical protein
MTPTLPARSAVECSVRGLDSAVRESEFEILIGSFLTVMSLGNGGLGNGGVRCTVKSSMAGGARHAFVD